MRGMLITALLALLIIVTIFSGLLDEKKSDTHQIVLANQKADMMLFESDIQYITTALNSFFTDRGRLPASWVELIPDFLKTEKEYLDPWGTPYRLDFHDESNMVIISAGKDKIFETPDDLKRRLK